MAATHICKDCGQAGRPVTETPGSLAAKLVAWICFLVPGILYTFWRLSARRRACPKCHGSITVPVDTPVGRQLCQAFGTEEALPQWGPQGLTRARTIP